MKAIVTIYFGLLNLTSNLNSQGNLFSENWSAKDYDKNSSLQFEAAMHLIGKCRFNTTDKVLDIGCGNGKITSEIAKNVPLGNVVGIDKAPDMVVHARQSYERPNLKFRNIEASEIPYSKEFDYACSFSCLHWVPDLDSALVKIYNCLKSNGKLLIFMELKNEYPLVKALSEVLTSYNLEIDWHSHTSTEIITWLENVGFKTIELSDFHIKKRFQNKEDLFNWIASFPYGFNFDAPKRNLMIQKIVDRYIYYYPEEPDGSIFVIFPETVISAVKP